MSAAGEHCTQGARRFACASSDARFDWWKQAWQSFEDEPLAGTGAGSFQLAHRLRREEFTRPVTEPHNFALQMLGETGIVGFLLFAGAVGFAVAAVRRRLRDDAAVALAVCALAYLVHILIDVGYDFVAVSAPFFTLLGVLLAEGKTPVARREPVWAFGALLLAATVVLSLAAPYVAQRKVDEAVATRDPELAAQAHSWNPVSILPLLTEAAIEEQLGHKQQARQLYRDAVSTQPENPDAWVELGLFGSTRGTTRARPIACCRRLTGSTATTRRSPRTAARSTARARRPSGTRAVSTIAPSPSRMRSAATSSSWRRGITGCRWRRSRIRSRRSASTIC